MTLHRLTLGDLRPAVQMLSRAFEHDPLVAHLFPAAGSRRRRLGRCFAVSLRFALTFGEVYATSPDLEGIAVWVPPAAPPSSWGGLLRSGALWLPLSVGPLSVWRLFRFVELIDRQWHRMAPGPMWYLQMLGVDPERRRAGHGSALVEMMLDRARQQRLACRLETVNPRNLAFYQRLGFQVRGEAPVPGCRVTCWFLTSDLGTGLKPS